MRLLRGSIVPMTHLCGSCTCNWSLEITTDPSWPELLPTILTQVFRFYCYGNYKSRNGSRFPYTLLSSLLPSLYVLQFTNKFPTNSLFFCMPRWHFSTPDPLSPPILSRCSSAPPQNTKPSQTQYWCHISFPVPIRLLLYQVSIYPV